MKFTSAPQPSYRFIPSRFPPIGLFDTVATAADAQAVMELAGWTNDRLAADRLHRLPQDQWVYGRPNSSVIMAAFLHSAPDGMRFNGPELGAWYASKEIETAAAEVGHHLRREAIARNVPSMSRTYRAYSAKLVGKEYCDIRGLQGDRPDLYRPDSYAAAQPFGERLRSEGKAGIIFDSVPRRGGTNMVAFIPPQVTNVMQTSILRSAWKPGHGPSTSAACVLRGPRSFSPAPQMRADSRPDLLSFEPCHFKYSL